MKVYFQNLPEGYVHPLQVKEVKNLLTRVISDEMSIRKIEFRFNKHTKQEGRVTFDDAANNVDIRINFCPFQVDINKFASPLISNKKHFVNDITNCGGIIDSENKSIIWSLESARTYTFFLLMHELAHPLYIKKHQLKLPDAKGSRQEEDWCDEFARVATQQYFLETGAFKPG